MLAPPALSSDADVLRRIVWSLGPRYYRYRMLSAISRARPFGATDKYDLPTGLPQYPAGFAEPRLEPRYPQQFAEIMAGQKPFNAMKRACLTALGMSGSGR